MFHPRSGHKARSSGGRMKNRRAYKPRQLTFTEVRRHNETRLSEIALLASNWDGEGAPQVSEQALEGAWKVLGWIARMNGPVMRIYPTRSGGINLETDDLDLEV